MINLDDLKHYSHKFSYTVQCLPKEGCTLFISRGAPEPFLYNKYQSWRILSERTLLCDCKGRLGLVIGPVKLFWVKLNRRKILDKIEFGQTCRGNWSTATGIFYPGRKRMIEICTIHDIVDSAAGDVAKYIGCTKVLVDDMLVPELSYIPQM